MAFLKSAGFTSLHKKQRFMQEMMPFDCRECEFGRQNTASGFLVF
jgi:hypothetical protein